MDSGEAIRFEVELNGVRLCVAGVKTHGKVGVVVNFSRRNPRKMVQHKTKLGSMEDQITSDIQLFVGGAADGDPTEPNHSDFLTWRQRSLRAGDEVLIRVLPPGEFDQPQIVPKSAFED